MRFTISGPVGTVLGKSLFPGLLLCGFVQTAWAGDPAGLVREIQRAIANNEDPQSLFWGLSASQVYAALFKEVGPEGIRDLCVHRNDSIALQAAWQEVAVTVPEKEPRPRVRPDHDRLVRFLGFLEGRARVRAPQWWADSLLDSRANRRDNIYPGAFNAWPPYHDTGLDRVFAPRDTSLKRDKGQIVLRVGSESSPIPADILTKGDTEQGELFACNISALIMPSRCYIAVHGICGHPHELFCIERSTGKVRWKTRVWGNFWGSLEGQCLTSVSVVEDDDRVLVFEASHGMNVEAFRSTDGTNLFRFATTY